MAKRFTDTEKWKDEWYGSLSNDYRIVWQYILDSCSPAGILKKDFRLLNFQCNVKLDEAQLLEIFRGRVLDMGRFLFVPKFLRFQYPKGLNSNKPAIVSVRKELIHHDLDTIIIESLGNDFLTVKDKDKDKDKEMDKGDRGVGEGKEYLDEDMPVPPNVLEAAEMNQWTMTKARNTEFVKEQWIIFLKERNIKDPPVKRSLYLRNHPELYQYFLNWIRNKHPKANGSNSKTPANGHAKPGRSDINDRARAEY